jgi:hypothetical protein
MLQQDSPGAHFASTLRGRLAYHSRLGVLLGALRKHDSGHDAGRAAAGTAALQSRARLYYLW